MGYHSAITSLAVFEIKRNPEADKWGVRGSNGTPKGGDKIGCVVQNPDLVVESSIASDYRGISTLIVQIE